MNKHLEIDYYDWTEEHGLIISFKDGSHTYLEPNIINKIISEVLVWNYYEEE